METIDELMDNRNIMENSMSPDSINGGEKTPSNCTPTQYAIPHNYAIQKLAWPDGDTQEAEEHLTWNENQKIEKNTHA